MLSGSADALTNYTGFAIVLFAGVAVAALFVLRAREPNAPRPFKALGYPVAPAVFVIACFADRGERDLQPPGPSGLACSSWRRHSAVHLAVTAAGIPLVCCG